MKVKGATTGQIASLIQATNSDLGAPPRRTSSTRRAQAAQPADGPLPADELRGPRHRRHPGNNDRKGGFDRIRYLLDPKDHHTGEQLEPLLHVHAGNDQLIDEFREYRWKPAPTRRAVGQEEPIKVNDDILDALRYVIMFRTIPGGDQEEDEPDRARSQQSWVDRVKSLRNRRGPCIL
jgi:hypothetical protein